MKKLAIVLTILVSPLSAKAECRCIYNTASDGDSYKSCTS